MDFLQAAALAGAIITSQGALWRPVTVQTMLDQEQSFKSAPAGSVTNEYKKQKRESDCYTELNGVVSFSLSCAAVNSAGL